MAHWIKLTVNQVLDKPHRLAVYKCVRDCVGSHMLHVTEIQTKQGKSDTHFYHAETDRKQHEYVIPLVRDLSIKEGHDLAHKLHEALQQVNWILDYSQTSHQLPAPHIQDPHNLQEILDVWGKAQHASWQQDLLSRGWRYGIKMSQSQKTHPWLQPWESLPPAARTHNIQAVEKLIDVLSHAGYQIVKIPQA